MEVVLRPEHVLLALVLRSEKWFILSVVSKKGGRFFLEITKYVFKCKYITFVMQLRCKSSARTSINSMIFGTGGCIFYILHLNEFKFTVHVNKSLSTVHHKSKEVLQKSSLNVKWALYGPKGSVLTRLAINHCRLVPKAQCLSSELFWLRCSQSAPEQH